MVKYSMMAFVLGALTLLAGCGGNGSYYDGSEGRAYNQSRVQSGNQQWAITGQGKYQAPGSIN